MKLTFLGTSHGLPGKGRHCTCNMIEIGNDIYLVDAGAPISDIFFDRDIGFERVKSVFVTHQHMDHFAGLVHFLEIAKWHFRECKTQCYFSGERVIRALQPILDSRPDESNMKLGLHMYKEGTFYDDGKLKVTAIRTHHMDNVNSESYAFDAEAEGKSILFTGDLTETMYDFPEIAFEKHYDCVVTECAHAKPETLESKIAKLKTDAVVVNHIYPYRKMDYIAALDMKYGFRVMVGNDNDELDI